MIDAQTKSPTEYQVGGTTYSPNGSVESSGSKNSDLSLDPIRRLAEICAVCNDARIIYQAVRILLLAYGSVYSSSSQEKDAYSNVGEPTEAALKVLVEKLGCPDTEITNSLSSMTPAARASAVSEYYERNIPRLLTFEFSRDRKMMSVLVRLNDAGALFVKGAPESVLERCTSVMVHGKIIPMTSDLRNAIHAQISSYASNGLRTLATAYVDEKDTDATHYMSQSTQDYARFEQNLVFVSLVGMLDPPRPEVRGAIANCRAAGIRVICITGDNQGTAEAICRQIGIFHGDEDLTGKSYTGRELDALSHEEKIQAVQRASLFSRTEPGHKSQLVDLLQGLGMVVAMARFSLSISRVSISQSLLDG